VTDNVSILLIDPEDQGFYKSRTRQWAAMCPHMNSTEYRVLVLLADLCSERNPYRKITLAEIGQLLPSGKTAPDGTPKPASLSTVASCLNTLAALGQITDEQGNPLRVSNKTKGALRVATHRMLRHECTSSRNVYDALARIRGGGADEGPRWPQGLGDPAQNSVPTPPPAQDSVPAAQNSVPPAQDSVPTLFETPTATSENTDDDETPFSSSLRTPTHTPGSPDATGTETDGVCVEAEPETEQPLIDVLVLNVVKRAPASKQGGDDEAERAIMAKARACIHAGAAIDDIDTALSAVIDASTRYPIAVGLKALDALLRRVQGTTGPLGTTPGPSAAEGTTAASEWTDKHGNEWPNVIPERRACGGRACYDVGKKRYISIVQPGLGAFSCPTCRNVYQKIGSPLL
jgi:hypothetical protein